MGSADKAGPNAADTGEHETMNHYQISSVLGVAAAGLAVLPAYAQSTGQNNAANNSQGRPVNTSQVQGTSTGAAAASATLQNGRYRVNNRGTNTGAAAASGTSVNGRRGGTRSSATPVTVYGNASSILTRAAEMMRESRLRASNAPTGARESYLAATRSFERMFRAYGASSSASATGRGTSVTSGQAADDVRTLRASKRTQVASLYATGAKEFFTAQLREALLGPSTLPPIVLRGNRRNSGRTYTAGSQNGTAASAVQQPDQNGVDPNTTDPNSFPVVNSPVSPFQTLPGGAVTITPGNTIVSPVPGNGIPQLSTQPFPQLGAPNTVIPPGTIVTPGTVIVPGTPTAPVVVPPVTQPTQPAPQPAPQP